MALPQTNIQLYTQLRDLAWTDADIERVRAAHDLAINAVPGRQTGTGKPFMCHLVGVASIVAEDGGNADDVIVGLLHAIYTHGDFGLGRVGKPRRRSRAAVRAVVGDDVEQRVYDYTTTPWSWDAVDSHAAALEDPATADEMAAKLLVRAANDVDIRLDHGEIYRASATRLLTGTPLADLAARAGHHRIAGQLHDLIEDSRATLERGSLAGAPSSVPPFIPPASWRMRLVPRLRQALRQRSRSGIDRVPFRRAQAVLRRWDDR